MAPYGKGLVEVLHGHESKPLATTLASVLESNPMGACCALGQYDTWSPDLRLHKNTLVFSDGRTRRLKPLGKGMFTRAYVTEGLKRPEVYLFTKEGVGDYSKEIMLAAKESSRSAYLPKVEKVGDTNDAVVYKEPLYRSPLHREDGDKAFAEYKALKRCWNWAQSEVRSRHGWQMIKHSGYEVMDNVVSCMKGTKAGKKGAKITPSRALVSALASLRDETANYGSEWTFEFSPKNLATTDKGHLILLDPVFSMEAVLQVRRARARGLRGWPAHVRKMEKQRKGRFFGLG